MKHALHPCRSLGLLLAALLLVACGPARLARRQPPTTIAAPTAAPTPTATLSTPGPGVADILAHPPAPGQTFELDAYYSGTSPWVHHGPPPPPDAREPLCPMRWADALTDRPFQAMLSILNGSCSNGLPDDAPFLVAVTPEGLVPGVRAAPELPYHARLRGHLGDPAMAHCPDAARIFVVEQVVQVYEDPPPEEAGLKLPADFAAWPRYHEAGAGFSLPHPADWQVQRLDDVTWSLRDPRWPGYPVWVRLHVGEMRYDPYDPGSTPPRLQGESFGVYEQGWAFGQDLVESQHLSGYRVDRPGTAGEREVAVFFSGGGRTYELGLRYPQGFDAPQALLTAYSALVEGFRLDTAPGPSATPPVRQELGPGPFLTQDEALARLRQRNGEGIELLAAELLPEAEARRRAGACGTYTGHSDGVWLLTVRGTFEGTPRTMRFFLDAVSGAQLCGEEIGPNAAPQPTLAPGATATPAAAVSEAGQIAIYTAVVRHLIGEARAPGRGRWPVIFIRPRLIARPGLGQEAVDGGPLPAGLPAALAGLAGRVETAEPADVVQPEQGNCVRDGGVLLTLGPITLEPDGAASLAGEYHLCGLAAAGYEYRLERDGEAWRIRRATLRWIA